MIWQLRQDIEYRPKWYLNGFPKAGLHLLEMFVSVVAELMPHDALRVGWWAGTFPFNSWVVAPKPLELFTRQISRLRPGYYFKGHAGHFDEIDSFLRLAGVAHVFVYRDLRDVAVSHAHHITSGDDSKFKHPAKHAYTALGGFDEILHACIVGLGAFPGVVARWKAYAKWIDSESALAIKFEDLKIAPEKCARRILEYGIERTLSPYRPRHNFKIEASMFDVAVSEMVNMVNRPELSPTFREGKSGSWREVFKPRHVDVFGQVGGIGICRALGYEE